MTAVLFKFSNPDGTPVANAPFRITTRKPSFDETLHNGIQMPGDVEAITDAQGEATVELMAGFASYYLLMDRPGAVLGEDGCTAGLRYRFMVVESDIPLRVEDLIVTTPTFSRPWDEVALQIILDAKVVSVQSAAAALASELAAGVSEDNAAESASASEVSAQNSEISHQAAVVSAGEALASQNAAKVSELAAKGSQDAARASELSAADSAAFASGAVQNMQDQVDEATLQAGNAATSATNSATSAGQSANSATQAANDRVQTGLDVASTLANKNATAADVVAVTALKTDVTALKDETLGYRNDAMAAVGTLGAIIQNGGPVDLSGGTYPVAPDHSTLWKVTVGGTVAGAQGDTYGVGDTLMYAKEQSLFYKIDNTENVSSVAGKTGAVVLDKVDVGLSLVDNTADMAKPISTAVAAELAARTVTTSTLDVVAGHIVKVGDYGENGGAAISQANTVDADLLTVPATFLFASGGLHLPEASVYLKHMTSGAVGQAKQLAWGLLTDKTYVRTQVGGIWSAWAPSTEIIDNLTSTDANKALSAKQGKVLYDMVQANNATIIRYTYNIAQGQTAVTGLDLTGKTLSYVPGSAMLVNFNGADLWIGNDFTASNGSLLTLLTAAETAGEMAITVFGSFSVADHYTKAEGDARYVQKTDTIDPWAHKPLGEFFGLLTHLAGVTAPPTDKAYRYIKLTAGDAYNTGALGNESTTGAAPLVQSTGVVTLAGSPLLGQTIQLINTEGRIVRPSVTSGSLLQDALQNIVGNVGAFFRAVGAGAAGALGANQYGATPPKAGTNGVDGGDSATITFDASLYARTSTETRMKSIGAVFYMRIK